MSRGRLAILAGVVGLAAWVVARIATDSGASPVAVPWTVGAVAVLLAVAVLGFGWTVRQYRKGRNPGLNALRAARTAVLAQACAYTGAIIAGAFAGYGLVFATMWSHEPRREVAISAFLAAAGGLALTVAGLIAEHWCRDSGADDDNKGGSAPA